MKRKLTSAEKIRALEFEVHRLDRYIADLERAMEEVPKQLRCSESWGCGRAECRRRTNQVTP